MRIRVLRRNCFLFLLLMFAVGLQAMATESREGNLIAFADANVKAICVANWDTDGYGELSFEEAAAVTDLGSAFQSNESITSFDELQYFTGLTSIGIGAFSGCANLSSVVIPNTVTSIGEGAFEGCTSLVSIEIPNLVTSIGDYAFAGCDNLNSIVLPETLISIGSYAFMTSGPDVSSELTSITIPNMVTSIGDEAFAGLGLTSITIPSSVTSIGINPFAGCTSLETITVETGNQVYDSRDNCNAIIETATNTLISGCQSTIIPNTVTSIGVEAFAWSGLTSIIIPNTVTSIGEGAFEGCTSLVSIEIPNTVTSIGDYAFAESGLTSITIPNSVTSIGEGTFQDCTSLVSIEIPNSVTSIGDYAFAESGLTSITIPSSVTSIGNYAFAWSGLTTITVLAATPPTIGGQAFQDVDKSIPVYVRSGSIDLFTNAEGWNEFTNFIALTNIEFADANVKAICVANWDTDGNGELSFEEAAAVTDLGAVFQYNEDIMSFDELQYFTGITSVVFENGGFAEGCFMGCPNLTSLTLPCSVTAIGDYAFYECTSLTSINIPNSVTAIGESAFEFAGLTAVNIPNSVTSIGISAFNGCESLVSATIPDALTTIEENVFGGCSSLTSINIPGSVTSIGYGAFSWCIGLASMTVNATTPPVLGGTSVFDEVDKSIPVYVPGGTTNAYRAAEGWDEFFNYIETSIFFADANVKQICVANWDTDGDGELSFEEAAAVTDLSNVFQDNTEITSFDELQYFTGLTSIGEEAFVGCTSLVSIEIPNSVTGIGNFSFTDCSSLNTIVIPASVTTIGIIYPFAGCNSLESITVEEGNMVYDSRDNCNAIIETATNTLISGCQNTIIPNTVTNIGMGAFAGCSNLTSIIIPNSVTSIGDFAFAGCTGLTSMIIFNTNVEMGNDVFDDITIPETLFVSASASPADGGGLFGLSQGGGGSAFVGTLVNELSIEFASQGSGEIPSNKPVLLMAKPNEGWQFVGWQINGELVSDEAFLMFRAFGEFAFEALFEPCGAEPEPELLSGRFSVSDCSTIGFARSNTIMSMTDLNMLEAAAIGVAIPGLHYVIGENQWDRMTYDASALNGNDEAYQELLLTGVDIFPSFFLKNNIDCWHIPTWREWDYMLNQRETASGIRFACGIVNEVSGLIVLPDDWEAATYTLSNVNEIGNYDNNVIDAATWTTVLEPAGAVFLPANGYVVQGQLIQETSDGQALGAYPGLLFSPSGELMGQMEGFPITGPMTLMLDLTTMAGMMNSSSSGSFGGTSVRLAKAMDISTATVVLATNDAERGTVTGGGEFVCQQECTVTAMANDGYVFMYWLEDGVAISVDPIYNFKLLGDRNLTAVFAPVDEVCQMIIETTAPSNTRFQLEWFGMGLSVSFDDGTPSYHIPFGTSPESLDFLEILQLMQSMQSGNTNTNYTFTVNILRGSNVSLDVWMPEDMINLMMGSGGSISDLGLTFTVSYVDGATIVENSSELPYNFLCNCADITLLVDPEEGGAVEADGALYIGETVTLTAVANEHYSFINWTFNGVEMSTEPSFVFEVTEGGEMVAHFEAEPTYTVAVSVNPDESGTVSFFDSNNAPVDFEDSTIPNEWNNAISSYPWIIWNSNPHTGSYCMASSNYNVNSSSSFIDATFEFVEDGSIEFYSRVSSESVSYDWGAFYIDGVEQFREGGTAPNTWTLRYYEVTAGIHTFRWYYCKDNIVTSGEDRYFIDDIVFTGLSGGSVFYYGETCVLVATPAENYHFVNWIENGEEVSTENPYSFTVTGNRDLEANFALDYYDITAEASPEECGTVTGAGTYNYGIECTLNATANVGYTFINWTLDGNVVSTEPSYTFTVTGGGAYVANFMLNSYTIMASANPSEGGTVSGAGGYNHFETCTLTATASEGYDFNNWTLDGEVVSTESTYAFTVTGPAEYVANFSLKSYDITATVTPSGAGTVTGTGTYYHGSQCTLTAIANEGYAFSNWMENGEIVSTDAAYAFTVTGEHSLVAAFLPTYVITVEANNAAYGTVTGGGTYMEGETCTVTATPAEGYVFSAWTEDGVTVSTDAIYGFTVESARNLVAVFLPTYVITAEANNAAYGTVTGGGTYVVNKTCTVTASPAEGYEFVNWTENGEVVSTEAEYAFTVTGDRSLVANFVLKNYDILATANPGEGGTVSGAGNYNHFETCTLVATANWGYTFINWTLDGNVVSTEPSYTFTVTSAGEYTANFQLNNYAVNASANPSEGGSVSGTGNYDHGTECTLTATANVGYTFVNWTLDGVEVGADPTYTFTVYEEAMYVANFSLNLYEITAIANPVEGGTITGAGNYYHGDECILTAIPIENYTFLYWTENGNYLSSEATYSFVATSDRSLVAIFAGNEQTMSLSPGWTWLSSYIEIEGNDGLGMLEDGLNPNGVMIKSQRDGFVSYAGGMWIGTLDGISNEKMYLVNTNEASDVTFTGPVANMMNHPITLNPNWTWLGYPVPFAVDINDALANLNATNGDVVKSQSSFATYSMEDGWYGSLSTLTPGMGLMYQSHNNQPVTFNYGVGMSRALKANLTAEDNHWVPDIHAYPNNMSIMAVVELNGVELQDERYELAVFNGSECRGSARLAYVPSLRRYVAFLTVTGEDDVDLYLALYDTMTGKAYYNTTDCPNFEANAVLGSLSMPFVARFGGTTDVDELHAPNIELYPNPVVAGHLFQMEMPAECQGARVSIVNALGAVISTTDVYDEPATLRAPTVPGVYTVRIVTDKQGTFTRKLIVNK